jgi:hypothetical protein
MFFRFPGRYRDRYGEEEVIFEGNGRSIRVTIRGIVFEGIDFDDLVPVKARDVALASQFTFAGDSLSACEIELEIRLPVFTPHGEVPAMLWAVLVLGQQRPTERLKLRLHLPDRILESAGGSGWFEDELLDLQQQLSGGTYLKACINCAFSDYSPYGHGLFGGLACFRDQKEAYRRVTEKDDLFDLWDNLTEYVPETYLCPEFERRPPGTGYRG